jgi:3-oxoacyl-(acyl-carrier-protein) synthase
MPRFSSPRRVAVTGLGLVSPLGIGNSDNWDALTAGRCGLGPITRFDASRFTSRIAGEVKGFDPALYIDKKEIKKMDIHYAMAAAHGGGRSRSPTRTGSGSPSLVGRASVRSPRS